MQQAASFWLLAVSFWHYTLNATHYALNNHEHHRCLLIFNFQLSIMIIRPYTKSELATMYFPIGSTSNALRRLNRYINNAHGLLPALLATGYRVNDRHFTRRQVQLIFEYLGEP